MTLFGGQDLFGSGPHHVEVGALELRHALHETPLPQGRGGRLLTQGIALRPLTQRGSLVADDLAALTPLLTAIEATLDGEERELIDPLGRSWPSVVLVAFRPGTPEPLGARWHVEYRADYLQVKP